MRKRGCSSTAYERLIDEGAAAFEAEVFPAELEEIARRRAAAAGVDAPAAAIESPAAPSTERELIGLAFSGGGIRSATFNLGILQGLHRHGVLKHVDYLSTVSGGGYVGSCLSSLMRKKGSPFPFAGGPEEPAALSWLRDRSEYLAPRGFLDLLRMPTLLIRGVLGNFALIFPYMVMMALAVALGRWFYGAIGGHDFDVKQWTNFLHLTPWLIGLVMLWTLASFPLALVKRNNLEGRKLLEYSFVWGWAAIPVLATAELQPYFLRVFHAWLERSSSEAIWTQTGAAVTGLGAILAGGQAVVILKPIARPLGLGGAALAGFAMPYLGYLYVADAIAYGEGVVPYAVTAAAAAVFVAGFVIADVNAVSMHGFYRDRLSEAFLVGIDTSGDLGPEDDLPLSKLSEPGSAAPYHLINASLNLQGSGDLRLRGRNSDFFVFSKRWVGSLRTGWVATEVLEKIVPDVNLGTAMAISGAAASPNMGSFTMRPVVFLMTLLNIRLGYWIPNPRKLNAWCKASPLARSIAAGGGFVPELLARIRWAPSVSYFGRELLSSIHELGPKVNVSDGGHLENTGIYALLQRRCRFIIAGDGEADPLHRFEGLSTLMRFARTDLGVEIEISLDDLRLGEGGRSMQQCALGTIRYPARDGRPAEIGHLLYLKASTVGDEEEIIEQYRAANPDYPHESTADQMFDEAQFEAYRALGDHIVDGLFAGRAAVPATVEDWFRDLEVRIAPRLAQGALHADLSRELAEVEHALREPRYAAYFAELYPELVPAAPAQQDLAQVFHLINRQIQLMERAFSTLRLDRAQNRAHPWNRGWINLFERWSTPRSFRRAFGVSVASHSAAFQEFCEDILGLRSGLRWAIATQASVERLGMRVSSPMGEGPGELLLLAQLLVGGEPGPVVGYAHVKISAREGAKPGAALLSQGVRHGFGGMALDERMLESLAERCATLGGELLLGDAARGPKVSGDRAIEPSREIALAAEPSGPELIGPQVLAQLAAVLRMSPAIQRVLLRSTSPLGQEEERTRMQVEEIRQYLSGVPGIEGGRVEVAREPS